MSDEPVARLRRPRSDAQRNRERLVEAANSAFADMGGEVSLEEIARRAGVGIGTLYRHFPTRASIVEAVYRREVEKLAGSAAGLLAALPPGKALHQWMRLFVDYIATKKVIAPALASSIGSTNDLYVTSGAKITSAIELLVERSKAAGQIRQDASADDILRALLGFAYGNTSASWQASALRLIDILMDGLGRTDPNPAT